MIQYSCLGFILNLTYATLWKKRFIFRHWKEFNSTVHGLFFVALFVGEFLESVRFSWQQEEMTCCVYFRILTDASSGGGINHVTRSQQQSGCEWQVFDEVTHIKRHTQRSKLIYFLFVQVFSSFLSHACTLTHSTWWNMSTYMFSMLMWILYILS